MWRHRRGGEGLGTEVGGMSLVGWLVDPGRRGCTYARAIPRPASALADSGRI
jgi:hypothetical protein